MQPFWSLEIINVSDFFIFLMFGGFLFFVDNTIIFFPNSTNEMIFFEGLGVAIFLSNFLSEMMNWVMFTIWPLLLFGCSFSSWGASIMQSFEETPLQFLKNLPPAKLSMALGFIVGSIEVFSVILRPLTLGLRLMANMLGGHLILEFLGEGKLYVGAFFMANYEIFVCFMQSLIFVLLVFNYNKEMLHTF